MRWRVISSGFSVHGWRLLLGDGAGFSEASVKAPGGGKAGGKGENFCFFEYKISGRKELAWY